VDNSESIAVLLGQLVSENPGAVGCLIVGLDGVTIQSNLPDDYSIDYLAAGGASLTVLADSILKYSAGGDLERLRISGTQGQMLAIPIADDIALIIVARRGFDADQAFEAASNTALMLSQYL